MDQKKRNSFAIILSILLIVISYFSLLTILNYYKDNTNQLNKIDEFSRIKNENESIIFKFSNNKDTELVLSFAKTLDIKFMKIYCDNLFVQRNLEKEIYRLFYNGLTIQEANNLLRAKKNYDDIKKSELWTMRLISESVGIATYKMPKEVREVTLTESENNLSQKEKRKTASNYLTSPTYQLANSRIENHLKNFRNSIESRYYYDINLILDNAKKSITNMSIAIAFLIILQTFVFINFYLVTRKQKIEINKANIAKGDFLSRISHDMRTPMNAIIGFSGISLNETTTNEERLEYCKKIQSSSKYLLGLINDVLDMSKIEENKFVLNPKPHFYKDFEKDIKALLLPLAEKKGITFRMLKNSHSNYAVEFDKMRLQQVFVNLINNAIKFTPKGGVVECEVITEEPINGYVPHTVIVRDSGIGISEDFIKNKLFNPFEQEHSDEIKNEQGTGLGLSIVKNIIDIMKGTITCESELGKGTTFTIKFKCKLASDFVENNSSNNFSLEILNGKKVLLCEDHPLNIQIAKKLLERQKMNVVVAENGKIGLDIFANSKINEYDIILMDIRMPIMDGFTTTRNIRSLLREDARTVPIVAMTANAFLEDIEQSFESGMNGHLSKPVDPNLMYQTMSKEISLKNNSI